MKIKHFVHVRYFLSNQTNLKSHYLKKKKFIRSTMQRIMHHNAPKHVLECDVLIYAFVE